MHVRILTLVLIGVSLLSSRVSGAGEQTLGREFSQRLTAITVENPNGVTEAQTWAAATVKVIASRQTAEGAPLDSEVFFETPAPDNLKVTVRLRDLGNPVKITVYAPSSINISVRSLTGDVSIKGAFAGLSVHTESGAITLHLPNDSNADLSLRTIEGKIDSALPLKLFGRPDAHVLDARSGQGGSTVIARSSRGNIVVLPDAASRIGSASKLAAVQKSDPARHQAMPGIPSKPAVEAASSLDVEAIRPREEMLKLEARLVNLNVKVTDVNGKCRA